MPSLTIYDLIAARDAMESWVDAFYDDQVNDDAVEKVKRVILKFNQMIEQMQNANQAKLKPVDVN